MDRDEVREWAVLPILPASRERMIVHGLPRIMKNTPYLLGRMDTLCLGNMLHTRMASLPCGALAYVVLTSQGPIVLGSCFWDAVGATYTLYRLPGDGYLVHVIKEGEVARGQRRQGIRTHRRSGQ